MKDVNLDSVDITPAVEVKPYTGFFPKNVFDGLNFFYTLPRINTHLWIMTYSVSTCMERFLNIDRLLYSVGESNVKNKRKLQKIHTKLFIVLHKNKPFAAYVGSQNFVAPTTENIMVKLPKSDNKFAVDYFLHYWNQAK